MEGGMRLVDLAQLVGAVLLALLVVPPVVYVAFHPSVNF